MECIASVYRNGTTRMFNVVYGSMNGRMTGYFNSTNSRDILDCIKKKQVLNHIEHTGDRLSHLLVQPVVMNKSSMNSFMQSQFCIGIAKGLRDRKDPKNFFGNDTKSVDATSQSIRTGKTMITLVPEMNLTHALNASQLMNVLRCIVNRAGVKIEDILIFNLTVGDFWCITSI